MTVVLSSELTKEPQREEHEERSAWRARFTAAHQALQSHLAEVIPGKSYYSKDDIPNGLGWEVGVLKFFVNDRVFVPDFQLDETGNFRTTVGAVGILLDRVPLPWGNNDVRLPLWWLTIQPELGCAPYELLGTDRNDELTKLASSIGSRR